ncbi:MAG: methionyl-tRNA formyltransferase [Oscillospiraceae bacterium]|nr:methionyl-tRNA formyltransferase [Oscillospiraceae bacterium]
MRIVFMGTPEIAATCLQRLLEDGHEIAAVYTKPDTPKGRGHKLAVSPVKALALSRGLPVQQPTTFRDDAVCDELRALCPALIAVVAYGKILPQRVLDIPPQGCINIHGSLLPALRGSGPVQWAILNHLDETGVTAMYLAAEMDAGDLIAVKKTPIDPMETSGELMDRLAVLSAELLSETVARIENGTAERTPQDARLVTLAPMLTRDLSPIDWSKSRREIIDQVRGLQPWPVATAELGGTWFKIYRVEPTGNTTGKAPGTLLALTRQGLEIACGGGDVLAITALQAEGGKRMAAADYFRGHPIAIREG